MGLKKKVGYKKKVELKKNIQTFEKKWGKKNHHNSWKKRGGKNKKWVEKKSNIECEKIAYMGQNMLWLEAHT